MVDEVKIKAPGSDLNDATLTGAATEATLKKLLERMPASKNGAEQAARNLEKLGKEARGNSKLFAELKNKSMAAQQAMQDFGSTLLKGSDKFGDYTQSMFSYMGMLGPGFKLLATGLQAMVNAVDNQVLLFREFSKVGADFGDSIFDSQLSAAKAGISLDTLKDVVTANADTLALLGGSVNAGRMRFVNISKTIQQNVQPQLSRLGMTTADTSNFLLDYLEIQTELGQAQNQTDEELIRGTEFYIKELDLLSRVTGMSRKEASEALKQQQKDTQLKSFLASLPAELQTKIGGVLASIEKDSPALAAALKEFAILDGGALSDNAIGIQNISGQLPVAMAQFAKGAISAEEFYAVLGRSSAVAGSLLRNQGQSISIQQFYNKELFGGAAELTKFKNMGAKSSEAMKEQTAAMESNQKGVAEFESAMVKFKNILLLLVNPALTLLSGALGLLVTPISYITKVIGKFASAIGMESGGAGTAFFKLIGVVGMLYGGFKLVTLGLAAFGGALGKLISSMAAMVPMPSFGGSSKGGRRSKGGGLLSGLGAVASTPVGFKASAIGGAGVGLGAAALGLGAGVGVGLLGAGAGLGMAAAGKGMGVLAQSLERITALDSSKLKDIALATLNLSSAAGQFQNLQGGFFGSNGPKQFANNLKDALKSLDEIKIPQYTNQLEGLNNSFAKMNANMTGALNNNNKTSTDKLDVLNSTMKDMLDEMRQSKRIQRDSRDTLQANT